MNNGTFGYLADNSEIWIPDIRLYPQEGDEYIPTRGFGFTMAVRRDGEIKGYICIEDLGFSNVKEWMEAQHDYHDKSGGNQF